jgi:signal transduction histidine kinase
MSTIWEEIMPLYPRSCVAYALTLAVSVTVFANIASALGTADDAKAMLNKTVAALKADKAKTLDEINKGENGFLLGDIYPFCFNISDGKILAAGNPNAKTNFGKDVRTLKDAAGDTFGERLYASAKEGQLNEVSYKFPKPGPDATLAPKVSFVTAIGDLGCGVGYYK